MEYNSNTGSVIQKAARIIQRFLLTRTPLSAYAFENIRERVQVSKLLWNCMHSKIIHEYGDRQQNLIIIVH